ncbi:MAG TPA: 1-phosphofructokinase family hexose kinase [Planctomycetota bacterium]|jgi:1-phosphofructokinase family hexose kinase|nr:1-phosphofructokinase family hexose kinase [Planctomycetota bacterium]
MILTVTPNPALDYTIRLDALEIGKRAKYRDPAIDPAGKGINVSRMVRRLGEATLALGFTAGATGDLLKQGLDREGIPHELVPIEGLTRINVTLLTGPEGSATHLHGPGAPISPADVGRLLDRIAAQLPRARILVLSGSLPPGMGPEAVADLIQRARRHKVRSIVDVEKDVLAAAIAAGADIVKPNLLEAAEYLGRPVAGVDAALSAAREIVSRGAGAAVLTMRGEGAVAVAGGRCWQVRAPKEDVVRAIGAGDSFAAGLAVGLLRGAELPEALRLAAAAGTATALHPGTGLGTAEEIRRLQDRTDVREVR